MTYNSAMAMKAMTKLAVTTMAFFALAFPASAADLTGDWTLTAKVNGIAIDLKCYFDEFSSANVDGSCDGPIGSPATTGSMTGNKVTLKMILTMGKDQTLIYTGTLDEAGTSLTGTIAGSPEPGTFSMKKAAAPPPPASAPDQSFSGTWVFIGEVDGISDNMRCTFNGEGGKFTGTCTYEIDGDVPTTGTFAGSTVTFQNSVTRDKVPYDLTWTGTLDDTETSMEGEIEMDGDTGDFTAKKLN